MNICEINITYNLGSTGRIVCDLSECLKRIGWKCFVVAGYSIHNEDNLFCFYKHYPKADQWNTVVNRVSGLTGYRNKAKTLEAIKWIESKKPDLIHLHNIHGDWIHLPTLIKYIKKAGIPVVWTLHDCWSFTGRCSHFELNNCNKWEHGCYGCHYKKVYPQTFLFDFSKKMWKDKFNWFTMINKLTIVTPSEWLANYVHQSFLKDYPVRVIHNGINTEVFYCDEKRMTSAMFEKDKLLILGVANSWSDTKGLSDFMILDSMIDHSRYQIMMIGLNNRQMQKLPDSIIKVSRTTSAEELADYYRNAGVYLNLTYQDNYPTTNLEALCCGCPVISYSTGGSPESVLPGCGYVVDKGNLMHVYELVESTVEWSITKRSYISSKALSHFSREKTYKAYIELFKEISLR